MLWDYIKSLRKDNNEVSPENESDQMHPGPKDNVGILNRQYGSVFIRENISYWSIFKKGDWLRTTNYRKVSLTCMCCNLQEHIIVSNTLKHLDDHYIFIDCQNGFRARRSCETQLLTLFHGLAARVCQALLNVFTRKERLTISGIIILWI